MTTTAESSIRIYLLGRFEVVRGDHALRAADWPRRKAAALLQRLALEGRLVKEQVVDFLWPDADLTSGANNLYRTLHALRQTLDSALGPDTAKTIFTFADGILQLNVSVWVDVHEFKQRCAAFHSPLPTSHSLLANLQNALDLYRGDLLPDDPYAEWAIAPREELRRLHHEATLSLAAYHRDVRDYPRAISLLAPLLARDPADEPVHQALMRVYALAGRRHEALRQYQACVEALAAELDVTPAPETEALYRQILDGELAPPPAPHPPPPWMPPAPITIEVERSGPFVGREVELETLRAQMHTAWRGQGSAILLAGDTGVGKTRLAYEALRAAASAGMITLFGAAYEHEGQLTYQPFIEAFNRYLVEQQRPSVENPITYFKPLGVSDPQQEQWALFNAVAAFMAALATDAPLVLLLDDLHAADETSLRLFHYLARHTRNAPIILLATYRTDLSMTPASPFIALLNALYRERLRTTINLSPLRQDAVTAIVAHTQRGEVHPALGVAIYEITEGNPFFAQEVMRALLKSEQIEKREGQWCLRPGVRLQVPSALGELLRERVARLGPAVVSALETAAVAGREFAFELLRQVSMLSEDHLLDALDTALTAQLIEETAYGYRFRHGLIRRVLYEGQSRPRRGRLHTLVAKAIETMYGQRPAGLTPYVETLAYHYELSDSRECALPYLLLAGQKAAGLYAFEVAVDYFERVLALMNELGPVEPAQRWMILESLGWWGTILADTPRAVTRFEQALALPSETGWQPGHKDRVRLHRGAAVALITAGDTAAAEAHLLAALKEIDEREDAADYAHLLYNVAQLHWHRNEYQAAFDVAQRSLGIAERLNDSVAIARAFEMLALACHSLGEWQLGLSFEQQRAALAGPGLDVTEAFDVHL